MPSTTITLGRLADAFELFQSMTDQPFNAESAATILRLGQWAQPFYQRYAEERLGFAKELGTPSETKEGAYEVSRENQPEFNARVQKLRAEELTLDEDHAHILRVADFDGVRVTPFTFDILAPFMIEAPLVVPGAKTTEVSMQSAIGGFDATSGLMNQPLAATGAMKVLQLRRWALLHAETFLEKRLGHAREVGTLSEDGKTYTISTDRMPEFEEKMKLLREEPVKFPTGLSLSMADFEGARVTPHALSLLPKFIQ